LGVFFWAPVLEIAEALRADRKMTEAQAIAIAASDIVGLHQTRLSIPRRFSAPMREMLALQPRFTTTKGRRALTLLEHKRFRAAYDFMLLRAELGEVDAEIAKFWTDIQTCSHDERIKRLQLGGKASRGAVADTDSPGQVRKRPRRRRRKSAKPGP
jgi:poly(A) polymerase